MDRTSGFRSPFAGTAGESTGKWKSLQEVGRKEERKAEGKCGGYDTRPCEGRGTLKKKWRAIQAGERHARRESWRAYALGRLNLPTHESIGPHAYILN